MQACITDIHQHPLLNQAANSPLGFPGGAVIKNPSANATNVRDVGLIPGSGRFPGVGNSNLLWYSFLEDLMDRGAWWAARSCRHTTPLSLSFPMRGRLGECYQGPSRAVLGAEPCRARNSGSFKFSSFFKTYQLFLGGETTILISYFSRCWRSRNLKHKYNKFFIMFSVEQNTLVCHSLHHSDGQLIF